jgi:hypothetical protein
VFPAPVYPTTRRQLSTFDLIGTREQVTMQEASAEEDAVLDHDSLDEGLAHALDEDIDNVATEEMDVKDLDGFVEDTRDLDDSLKDTEKLDSVSRLGLGRGEGRARVFAKMEHNSPFTTGGLQEVASMHAGATLVAFDGCILMAGRCGFVAQGDDDLCCGCWVAGDDKTIGTVGFGADAASFAPEEEHALDGEEHVEEEPEELEQMEGAMDETEEPFTPDPLEGGADVDPEVATAEVTENEQLSTFDAEEAVDDAEQVVDYPDQSGLANFQHVDLHGDLADEEISQHPQVIAAADGEADEVEHQGVEETGHQLDDAEGSSQIIPDHSVAELESAKPAVPQMTVAVPAEEDQAALPDEAQHAFAEDGADAPLDDTEDGAVLEPEAGTETFGAESFASRTSAQDTVEIEVDGIAVGDMEEADEASLVDEEGEAEAGFAAAVDDVERFDEAIPAVGEEQEDDERMAAVGDVEEAHEAISAVGK